MNSTASDWPLVYCHVVAVALWKYRNNAIQLWLRNDAKPSRSAQSSPSFARASPNFFPHDNAKCANATYHWDSAHEQSPYTWIYAAKAKTSAPLDFPSDNDLTDVQSAYSNAISVTIVITSYNKRARTPSLYIRLLCTYYVKIYRATHNVCNLY